jgi:hypothetical protein
LKRILCFILLIATLLSAFSIVAFAEDNAQSGTGDTHGAASGCAWYNTHQYLWKVTLFVGKSDQANKSSNLLNDFHRIGTVLMKKTGWSVPSSVKFGSGTKADYYSGAPMQMDTSPKIISDSKCPKIPIVCHGNIGNVKAYFGSTGTVSTILNAIAEDKGTTKESMLKALRFTIGGRSQANWDYSYLDPNGTSNRVPWVIVYEPMVILNLKDKETKLAFTATEFALCELNGWYDWNSSNGRGQSCATLTERHLPTSVQLEESWFGYPVYAVTNDSKKWNYHDVVKGGGWGMRWLPVAIEEPGYKEIDFGTYFGNIATPIADGHGAVVINWRNYTSESGTVLCELYRGSTRIWSENKTIAGGSAIQSTFSIYYPGTSTQTLTAKINYANRNDESDPLDNIATRTVTPKIPDVKYNLDYGAYILDIEQPEQDSYGNVCLWWKNWTNISGSALCEIYLDGSRIYSSTKHFGAYEGGEQTLSIYYSGTSTRILEARINWAYKDYEKDPYDNYASENITPTQTTDGTYDFSVSGIIVSPSNIYQDDNVAVSFVSDNWNMDVAYDDILVELLVGNTVVKSEYVDFTPYGRNVHTYYVKMSDFGSQTVTARINWSKRNAEDNSYNNSAYTTATVKKYYEFSVSDLQITPATCYENDTVTVSFRTDSWDRRNAYNDIPVQLLYNGEVVYTEYVDYAAYGGKNHTLNLNVGGTVGVNNIKVRVNWPNHSSEINPDNNETSALQVTVKPKLDLTIEAITPNSDYRAGMTVVTSYRIYNANRENIIPSHNNTVAFEAYYYNGSTKVVISSQTWKQAVVPSYGNNLVYFKWTVPSNLAGKTVYCKAVVNSDNSFEEFSASNNTATLTRTVTKAEISQTPDTQYEETKPNGFTVPTAPHASVGTAKWSLWTYSNGSFVKKNYGVAISSTTPSIMPDEDSPSAKYTSGQWQMRSGYGIYLSYAPSITSISGYTMPSSSAYTAVQRVEAAFPEFKYSKAVGSFRSIEKYGSAWGFIQNTNADLNERLHFTPLWYPDGSYIISVMATDVWTPAGMISSVRNSNAIKIIDSAYDDWYVGEG